mmetsp:Transcript_21555/g.32079  ORF Transcript_21555/g.32079 Transcript_21555/m.32079 type:complete len:273 (+) Transcript_21555:626-1444(+)
MRVEHECSKAHFIMVQGLAVRISRVCVIRTLVPDKEFSLSRTKKRVRVSEVYCRRVVLTAWIAVFPFQNVFSSVPARFDDVAFRTTHFLRSSKVWKKRFETKLHSSTIHNANDEISIIIHVHVTDQRRVAEVLSPYIHFRVCSIEVRSVVVTVAPSIPMTCFRVLSQASLDIKFPIEESFEFCIRIREVSGEDVAMEKVVIIGEVISIFSSTCSGCIHCTINDSYAPWAELATDTIYARISINQPTSWVDDIARGRCSGNRNVRNSVHSSVE